jgi:hypothetical protein
VFRIKYTTRTHHMVEVEAEDEFEAAKQIKIGDVYSVEELK